MPANVFINYYFFFKKLCIAYCICHPKYQFRVGYDIKKREVLLQQIDFY